MSKSTKKESPEFFLTPAPEFPVAAFPPEIRAVVEKASKSAQTPLAYAAFGALGFTGGLIGRSCRIQIKEGWEEHANLFLALVAQSGSGKTPAISPFVDALIALNFEFFKQYEAEMATYRIELAEWERQEGEKGPAPTQPKQIQILADDTTIESAAQILSANPRGLIWYRDELPGLIYDLDKYSSQKGGAKARLITAYDSGTWIINRVNKERNVVIRSACVSLFGTVQPKSLPDILKPHDVASGFVPRFLFAYAEPEKTREWSEAGFDPATAAKLEDYAKSLFRLGKFSFDESETIVVDTNAKTAFVKWFNTMSNESWTNVDTTSYNAFIEKMKSQCLRICLQLHALETVEGLHSLSAPLCLQTMEHAIQIITWFKFNQRQICSYVSNPDNFREVSGFQKDVANAIVALYRIDKSLNPLPTALITDKLNEMKNSSLKSVEVGRACSALGLEERRTSSARGYKINHQALSFLAQITGEKVLDDDPSDPIVNPNEQNIAIAKPIRVQQPSTETSKQENRLSGFFNRFICFAKKFRSLGTGWRPFTSHRP